MGTSGAWGGSGSAAAKSLRDVIDVPVGSVAPSGGATRPTIDPADLADAVRLLDQRTSSKASGPSSSRVAAGSARRSSRANGGRGGGGGGAQRSSSRTARTAGRAIAGAIAYRNGDRATLERLGLDLDALTRLGDPFEVVRRIVEMACGSSESTIEDHERRLMAAEVGERLVMNMDADVGVPPAVIAEFAVAAIIAEVILSECAATILDPASGVTEQDVRDAAESIASRVDFSVTGVSEDDFSIAIEAGLDTLRGILGIE